MKFYTSETFAVDADDHTTLFMDHEGKLYPFFAASDGDNIRKAEDIRIRWITGEVFHGVHADLPADAVEVVLPS